MRYRWNYVCWVVSEIYSEPVTALMTLWVIPVGVIILECCGVPVVGFGERWTR